MNPQVDTGGPGMRFLDEFRDSGLVTRLAAELRRVCRGRWVVMEVCGGQTHAILKHGLDQLLPERLTLVHGPGCPVCVTSVEKIDRAIAIARGSGAILCTFGDMMRVPGSAGDLFSARAAGGDVRIVYSPLDALGIAERNPGREVVFFAVGFETTAPATATAVLRAHARRVRNFSVLLAHVRVPPALELLLSTPDCRINGFLAPGHVCTVTGIAQYEDLARRFRVPIVVTGFEPVDIMQGLLMVVRQLEAGEARVENQYARSVRAHGNSVALGLIDRVFCVADRDWRGVGPVRGGGFALRPEFTAYDAEQKFGLASGSGQTDTECRAGLVLMGRIKPDECPLFGVECTPEHPVGAPMVSAEGACAAYYRYKKPVPGAGHPTGSGA